MRRWGINQLNISAPLQAGDGDRWRGQLRRGAVHVPAPARRQPRPGPHRDPARLPHRGDHLPPPPGRPVLLPSHEVADRTPRLMKREKKGEKVSPKFPHHENMFMLTYTYGTKGHLLFFFFFLLLLTYLEKDDTQPVPVREFRTGISTEKGAAGRGRKGVRGGEVVVYVCI